MSQGGRLLPRQLARRLWPFATVAWFGVLLLPMPGHPIDAGWYAAGTALTAAVTLSVIWAPWHRAPVTSRLLPALAYLVAVGCLRHAAGGSASGVGSLVLLPVLWVALYGTHRELIVVLTGVATTYALPLLVVGAPDYPTSAWRGGFLTTLLAVMIGTTVQRLITRVRAQAAAARAAERERERLFAQVEELARTDPLTGVGNRRAWEDALARALTEAARRDHPVTLALLDLDGFKALNDTAGHHAGDVALQDCARAWSAELRAGDTLARLGGDEFGVLLPVCDEAEAELVIARLREATVDPLGCSAGIAEWDRTESGDEWQRRADAELYAAKNRIRSA
jgi:diguanylate cyclase (GGDEF)-like protein